MSKTTYGVVYHVWKLLGYVVLLAVIKVSQQQALMPITDVFLMVIWLMVSLELFLQSCM